MKYPMEISSHGKPLRLKYPPLNFNSGSKSNSILGKMVTGGYFVWDQISVGYFILGVGIVSQGRYNFAAQVKI